MLVFKDLKFKKIMKKFIIGAAFCTLAAFGGSQAAFAETVTTTSEATITSAKPSLSDMMAQIQQLMKLIADLKAKLTDAQGQIQFLAHDLGIGAKGDDVLKAQELLASDPSIFHVKPTGFFGPLTEEAIKKFQAQYNLPVTGKLDEATREAMKELRSENKDGKVPPGFIKSKEVHDKIKARLQEKWGDCIWGDKFKASDCMKGHEDKEDNDLETNDDDNASSTKEHGDRVRGERPHASSSREFAASTTTPNASSTKSHDGKGHASSTVIAAKAAQKIAEAKTAINKLSASIASTSASSTDKKMKEAQKRLKMANNKLAEAKAKFAEKKYPAAIEKANQAIKAAGKPFKKEMKETLKTSTSGGSQ